MEQNNLRKIIFSSHGIIFLLGIFLLIVLGIFIFFYYFIDPQLVQKISAMVVTNVIVGRVPSISLGYASDLSHFEVIATNVYIEMIMVTLIYSVFVFSYQNMLQIKYLDTFFHKIHDYREKYSVFFDRYGLIGLFIFVFIPFWMTGPIVGAIIGYLIGLRHSTTISTVFVATILAITLWGLLLNELVSLINMVDSSLIWIILLLVISMGIILKFKRH